MAEAAQRDGKGKDNKEEAAPAEVEEDLASLPSSVYMKKSGALELLNAACNAIVCGDAAAEKKSKNNQQKPLSSHPLLDMKKALFLKRECTICSLVATPLYTASGFPTVSVTMQAANGRVSASSSWVASVPKKDVELPEPNSAEGTAEEKDAKKGGGKDGNKKDKEKSGEEGGGEANAKAPLEVAQCSFINEQVAAELLYKDCREQRKLDEIIERVCNKKAGGEDEDSNTESFSCLSFLLSSVVAKLHAAVLKKKGTFQIIRQLQAEADEIAAAGKNNKPKSEQEDGNAFLTGLDNNQSPQQASASSRPLDPLRSIPRLPAPWFAVQPNLELFVVPEIGQRLNRISTAVQRCSELDKKLRKTFQVEGLSDASFAGYAAIDSSELLEGSPGSACVSKKAASVLECAAESIPHVPCMIGARYPPSAAKGQAAAEAAAPPVDPDFSGGKCVPAIAAVVDYEEAKGGSEEAHKQIQVHIVDDKFYGPLLASNGKPKEKAAQLVRSAGEKPQWLVLRTASFATLTELNDFVATIRHLMKEEQLEPSQLRFVLDNSCNDGGGAVADWNGSGPFVPHLACGLAVDSYVLPPPHGGHHTAILNEFLRIEEAVLSLEGRYLFAGVSAHHTMRRQEPSQ